MKHVVFASILAGSVFASAALVGGCARREHIRPDHGETSRQWHEAQRAATEVGPASGLDSEEAAAIHESYRRVLTGDAPDTRDDSEILILEEGRDDGRRR